MKTWVWKSWGGHRRSLAASDVNFQGNYVLFYGAGGRPILAINSDDCLDLHPEDAGDPEWWAQRSPV